jgi:hypothetical protein
VNLFHSFYLRVTFWTKHVSQRVYSLWNIFFPRQLLWQPTPIVNVTVQKLPENVPGALNQGSKVAEQGQSCGNLASFLGRRTHPARTPTAQAAFWSCLLSYRTTQSHKPMLQGAQGKHISLHLSLVFFLKLGD